MSRGAQRASVDNESTPGKYRWRILRFLDRFSWKRQCTTVFSVTIVANIFRGFPRTLETFWWVTGHPGWVLGHIQWLCTRRIMFLTMFYSPLCSKSMLGTFAQVVEKIKSSLVTTRKNMDLSVKYAYVLKYSNQPLNRPYAHSPNLPFSKRIGSLAAAICFLKVV